MLCLFVGVGRETEAVDDVFGEVAFVPEWEIEKIDDVDARTGGELLEKFVFSAVAYCVGQAFIEGGSAVKKEARVDDKNGWFVRLDALDAKGIS